MVPSTVYAILTPQETYFLKELYPKLPKNAEAYPAKLIVTSMNTTVTLNGTCGMDASLSEDEMIDILKHATSAVPSYHDPEGAIADKKTVRNLNDKLDITDKASEELFNNFLIIMGWDDILGKLNPISFPSGEDLNGNFFHDYETIDGYTQFGDNIKDLYDILSGTGDLVDFVKPDFLPTVQDILYNGAKVTWEQFKKDQQKYRDIITLSQANARLRVYYNRVNALIRELQSKKGVWAIRIFDQQIVYPIYNPLYDITAPCSFIADVELKKDNGDYTSIEGSYTGTFTFKESTYLSEYDSLRAKLLADYLNKSLDKKVAGYPIGGLPYEPILNQINSPSQSYLTLQGESVSVTFDLPPGKNRTFFELPLDAAALEQTEYVNTCDYTITLKTEDKTVRATYTFTEIMEEGTYFQSDHSEWHEKVEPFRSGSTDNDDSGALPADIRPYIQMKLIVDMLD